MLDEHIEDYKSRVPEPRIKYPMEIENLSEKDREWWFHQRKEWNDNAYSLDVFKMSMESKKRNI